MSESESKPSPHDLLIKVNKLHDYTKSFLADRVEANQEATEDNAAEIADLQRRVAELEERMDTFAGIGADERSTPAKRAADLRDAMLKAAQSSAADGVTWWKDEVQDHLAALGHEDLHKPDIYDAMETAAEHEGFAETNKRVTKETATGKNRTFDARAIRVELDNLPGGDPR